MLKKILILAVAIICQSMSYAENRVPSTIKDVTVYRSGAKLQNVANVRLSSGENTIVFERLSPNCNPQSVQVRIKGMAELMSATFRTRNIELNKPDFAKGKILQDSVEMLTEQIEKWQNEQAVLLKEENLIEHNQARVGSSTGNQANPISLNELKELVNFYRSRITEIRNRNLDLTKLIQKMSTRRDDVQQRYYKAVSSENQSSGEIVMHINSASAQSVEITCIYLIYNASWQPLYDLRAESTDKPLNLIYKAAIRQASGEDWKNVKLHLSSAMPLTDNSRPILTPKYIDYQVITYNYDKKTKAYQQSEKANSYNLIQAPSNMATMPAAELNYEAAALPGVVNGGEENTQSFNEVFDVEPLHNILNAAQEDEIIQYKAEQVPAVYEYHAVPKIDPSVFLLAKVMDYGKYNLLSGNANIFYKDTYIGQSYIDTKTTQDTLLLSLGRDEEIVIKRVKPSDVTYAPKLFNNSKRETIVYDIIIKNNKSVPIALEILDQIPISKNSEIEVELEDKDGAEYNKDYGKLLWRESIAPRKNKTIRFKYTVKYPKDKVLNCQ